MGKMGARKNAWSVVALPTTSCRHDGTKHNPERDAQGNVVEHDPEDDPKDKAKPQKIPLRRFLSSLLVFHVSTFTKVLMV